MGRLGLAVRSRDAWTAGFLLAVFTPVLLRLLFASDRQGISHELVTITGLAATALLVCTVVPTSRLRSLTRAFGIESTMLNHRVLGLCTGVLVLVHVGVVLVAEPRAVALLIPFLDPLQPAESVAPIPLLVPPLTPPMRSLAGLLATVCLVVLAIVAAKRSGRYEVWRAWHLVLTAVALLGTAAHVLLIGHIIPTGLVVKLALGDPLGGTLLNAALADPADTLFLLGLALVVLIVALQRWVLRPLSQASRYQVAGVVRLSPTVSALTLRPVGRARTRFRPGQFAWLRLSRDPFGEEHPFTVSSAAQERHLEFLIKHCGDWTEQLRRLGPGDYVWIDGPHGALTPDPLSVDRMVLVAGGVGIAPMMAILRTAARDNRQRDISLMLTDRPSPHLLFRDELTQLQTVLDLDIVELAGAPLSAQLCAPLLPAPRDRLDYYVCGSPDLVSDAVGVLDVLEIPRHRIHTESFDI